MVAAVIARAAVKVFVVVEELLLLVRTHLAALVAGVADELCDL